jgi:hypothetical protein
MRTCLIEAEYVNPRMNTQEGNALQLSLSSFSAGMRAHACVRVTAARKEIRIRKEIRKYIYFLTPLLEL